MGVIPTDDLPTSQIAGTGVDRLTCRHLRSLEQALIAAGRRETFRGKAWSRNCREWVYFDCLLDQPAIRDRLDLPDCVAEHSNDDSKSGRESGFVCRTCHDAVMGLHPGDAGGKPRFP